MITSRVALSLAAIVMFAPLATAESVSSPDGRVTAEVSVVDGRLVYSVSLDGKRLLDDSPLGLVTSAGDFSQGLRQLDASPVTPVNEEYDLPNGKRSHAKYDANRAIVTVADAAGRQLSVVVQVSNDGVALAYRLLNFPDDSVVVERELTGFALPEGSTGFLHPMDVARSGWARTNPSYEAHYSIDRPVGEPSPTGQGWCLPALFKVADRGWLLVSETGVDGNYCGTHLANDSTGGVYTIAFPQPAENLPTDPIAPTVAGDAQLPWRTIMVGDSLAPIVASTLTTDLVEPKYEAKHEFPRGKAAWSWLFLKDDQTIFDTQRVFIDMAADLKLDFVLVDSMWDTQIGREKIAELVDYARGKGVGILLWYNSNGSWNDAPQTPRDRMHTPEVRAEEMAWLQKIGVQGVKVDFFGGDKQAGMQFYDDILTEAAQHGLSVNFHGTTLPRGWQRMYPNFATCEAVMGMEFCTFSQENADHEPAHCAILPFTRNVVGPMDFTPCILSERLGPWPDAPVRRTTDAFELALPVVFFSGIQHFGITPDQIAAQPECVRDYFRRLPTAWDETRLVDGYPGRFAVVARRHGPTWYVAAINGLDTPKTLSLPLNFAGAGTWTLLHDGDHGVVKDETSTPANGGPIELTLPPAGGAVLWRQVNAK